MPKRPQNQAQQNNPAAQIVSFVLSSNPVVLEHHFTTTIERVDKQKVLVAGLKKSLAAAESDLKDLERDADAFRVQLEKSRKAPDASKTSPPARAGASAPAPPAARRAAAKAAPAKRSAKRAPKVKPAPKRSRASSAAVNGAAAEEPMLTPPGITAPMG